MLKRSSPDTVAVKLDREKASGRHLYLQQKEKAISPRLQRARNDKEMLLCVVPNEGVKSGRLCLNT
eukprot:1137191-Pelagomonas_calceolata.AAC.8